MKLKSAGIAKIYEHSKMVDKPLVVIEEEELERADSLVNYTAMVSGATLEGLMEQALSQALDGQDTAKLSLALVVFFGVDMSMLEVNDALVALQERLPEKAEISFGIYLQDEGYGIDLILADGK